MSESFFRITELLGDPTRSEILLHLMDGRAFPASELACLCHVSCSTASHHLRALTEGGLLSVVQQGRYRYYRIADERVAAMIEALGQAPSAVRQVESPLAEARCCYSHLAGRVGVLLRKYFEEHGMIETSDGNYVLTTRGEAGAAEFGWCPPSAGEQVGRQCLDWTERRYHIGGRLGSYILRECIRVGWFTRSEMPRQLILTEHGRANAPSFRSDQAPRGQLTRFEPTKIVMPTQTRHPTLIDSDL